MCYPVVPYLADVFRQLGSPYWPNEKKTMALRSRQIHRALNWENMPNDFRLGYAFRKAEPHARSGITILIQSGGLMREICENLVQTIGILFWYTKAGLSHISVLQLSLGYAFIVKLSLAFKKILDLQIIYCIQAWVCAKIHDTFHCSTKGTRSRGVLSRQVSKWHGAPGQWGGTNTIWMLPSMRSFGPVITLLWTR